MCIEKQKAKSLCERKKEATSAQGPSSNCETQIISLDPQDPSLTIKLKKYQYGASVWLRWLSV